MQSLQPNRKAAAQLATAVLVGLVAFELISAFVRDLLAPLIAVFIGDSRFELNAFVIEGSEIRYGNLLEAIFVVLLAGMVVALCFSTGAGWLLRWTGQDRARECPDCTSLISENALRCPYCTSHLNVEMSDG